MGKWTEQDEVIFVVVVQSLSVSIVGFCLSCCLLMAQPLVRQKGRVLGFSTRVT